jgi:hypothetical protein
MEHMSNRWKAALAWIASMSVVWAIFVPRGISLVEFVSVSVLGLVVMVLSALLTGDRPPRSIRQILEDTKDEPRAAPVPVRMSKGPR